MTRNDRVPKPAGLALLITALIGTAALAGCIGSGDKTIQDTPVALLEVEETEGWAGEAFLFNASASYNPNGAISRWHFDFGDGTEFSTEDEDEAHNVSHAYEVGGVYNVTLTVTDDGANQTGKLTATDVVVVFVNDRVEMPRQVNYAAPLEAGDLSKSTFAFEVHEGATAYAANFTVTSMILAGTSSVTIRVLDAAGEVIDETEVQVDAGSETTAELRGLLESHGTYTIEKIVTSGGAATEGTLNVYYVDDALDRETDEEEDEEDDERIIPLPPA